MSAFDPSTLFELISTEGFFAASVEPSGTSFTWLALGLMLGLVHAFDADHVMAVSVFASKRRGARAGAIAGLRWSLGHGAVLLFVGALLIGLGKALPEAWVEWAERGVAVMMIGLGLVVFFDLWRRRTHLHFHAHDDLPPHAHWHTHERGAPFRGSNATDDHPRHAHHAHQDHSDHDDPKRGHAPLLVGSLHGLAGSAPILAVIAMAARSPALGLAYLLVFGMGVACAMACVSGILGHVAARLAAGDDVAARGEHPRSYWGSFRALSGTLSILVGVWMLGAV